MSNENVGRSFREFDERIDKARLLNGDSYRSNFILKRKLNELDKKINEMSWENARKRAYDTGASKEDMKKYNKLISEYNKLLQQLYPSMNQSKGKQKTLTKQMNPRKPNYEYKLILKK